jgi:hypothetical protein
MVAAAQRGEIPAIDWNLPKVSFANCSQIYTVDKALCHSLQLPSPTTP